MKLEKHIIDRKIRIMEEEGVKFFTNTDIGIDVKSKKLVEGFDRIVFACGASIRGTSMRREGMQRGFISRWIF